MNYKVYVTKSALPFSNDYLKKNKIEFSLIEDEKNIGSDKSIIFGINKGKFLQPCPGTPKYICCGYYVLSPVENCPFSCSYCILNAYFKTQHIKVNANVNNLIKELECVITKKNIVRIGSGEFSDSLSMKETLMYLEPLLQFFSDNTNVYLELKTKNHIVPDIFYNNFYKNVIFSWSMNSLKIQENEELGASSIDDRLDTAGKLAKLGYKISLHFDPIISYDGWENDYKNTIEKIYKSVPEKNIVYISLGILRFMPELKEIAQKKYPMTKIFKHEFIIGLDGKKRYFRQERVDIYKKMVGMIKNLMPNTFVYLCMENEDVWYDVFGIKMSTKKLKSLMDEQVSK